MGGHRDAMCGRYSLAREKSEARVGSERVRHQGRARYNIAPTQRAPVIRRTTAGLAVDELRWGLVPRWSRVEGGAPGTTGGPLVNARAETLADKPAFRESFRDRRCLVLADGFYEWQALGRSKQPWRFLRTDGEIFLMAGLWESWCPPGQATPLETFTVITTAPNAVVAGVHDRMPACLDPESAGLWLDPGTPSEVLRSLLKPSPDTEWTRHRVDPIVGQARIDDARCITEPPEQPSLF
jgi:putative SOS response-associated peptidase YedK